MLGLPSPHHPPPSLLHRGFQVLDEFVESLREPKQPRISWYSVHLRPVNPLVRLADDL